MHTDRVMLLGAPQGCEMTKKYIDIEFIQGILKNRYQT
jgi:hypothetical protein